MQINNRKNKLAVIHQAKKQLLLDDDDYRLILESAAGISSCSYLQTEQQFNDIMAAFEKLGYQSNYKRNVKRNRPVWPDKWACADNKRAKIEIMWQTVARNKTEQGLKSFIKRITGLDSLCWLDDSLATKIIQALGKMYKDAGLDFNTGKKVK